MTRNFTKRQWSKDDSARLLHMRDVEHKSFQHIAGLVGRSVASCESKYKALKEPILTAEDLRELNPRVPPAAIADRDARYQLWLQQSPAAALMGDPLPGRSALAQRGDQT